MSISEQATRQINPREKRRPVFIARAKIGNVWQTLGAAWEFRNGEPGLSVKLNTLPVGNWDGTFILLPPLPTEEIPEA
jgi:hypothetical protein